MNCKHLLRSHDWRYIGTSRYCHRCGINDTYGDNVDDIITDFARAVSIFGIFTLIMLTVTPLTVFPMHSALPLMIFIIWVIGMMFIWCC